MIGQFRLREYILKSINATGYAGGILMTLIA